MTSEHDVRRTGMNVVAVAAGAAAGALVVYMLRSPQGRRLLDAAIGVLDDFSFECARFSHACARAHIAAADGWQSVKGSTMTSTSTGGGRETVF